MLIDWVNDVLVGERIIVKDLAEDLYDGQVLQKLFGEESVLEKSLYCCYSKTQWAILNCVCIPREPGGREAECDGGDSV